MPIASGLDLARLSIIFDTTTAPGAISAMQQVVTQSRGVGQATDQLTQKQREGAKALQDTAAALNQLNQAHAAAASGYKRGTNDGAAYTRTVQELKAALDAEAKAAAAVASGHQQRAAAIGRLMAASRDEYTRGALSAQQYATRLQQLQTEMNKLAATQTTLASSGRESAQSMVLLTSAFGGFLGVFSFQALAGMTQFASFIAGLPGDLAHAGDEFDRLSARITFAFRGSTEAARMARQDMIAIARQTGVPLSQVSQSYGDIAIAGRGPGLTRGQIGGLVGGFATLGAMTGADNASTGRAMWQFQQALALGRLTSQDYRFMATNMPAIDDALAAGMGVDVNTIPGRISRGEIDANKMVDALIRGVEVLRDTSGGIPETMERARGRIQTEWELLLTNMESTLKSSELYQAAMRGVASGLHDTNNFWDRTPTPERVAWLEGLRTTNRYAFENYGGQAELDRMNAVVNDPGYRRTQERARMQGQREERRVRINTTLGRGLQAADGAFSLDLQRSDIQTSIGQIERALGVAGAANAPVEDIERLSRALTAFRTQLSRLVSVAERRATEADFAERDFARYGAGAGFDIAQSARSLAEQAAVQGRPIGDEAARGIILRERGVGIDRDLARSAAASADRQIIVDAAGLDAAARRRAALDAEMSGWWRDNYGARDDLSPDQRARADAQAAAFRQQRALELSQGDQQGLAERRRADEERLAAMRAQLAMGIQLGQQGRIALAQAERERELRREFPEITDAVVQAERARVAENVRIAEQLDFQRQQLMRLQDSAEAVGGVIGDVLGASIAEGVERGRIDGEAALNVLSRSASRILNNLVANMTAPWEKQITDIASGWFQRIAPRSAYGEASPDKAIEVLGGAAEEAGRSIAQQMVPSVTEAAAKMSLTVTATVSETAAKSKALFAITSFTGAVVVATRALEVFATSAAASGGGDIASAVASVFGGKSSKSVPGFASGVRNFSGGWAIVGEEGAELVNLPRGANVLSHRETSAMLGGSKVSVVVIDQRTSPNSEQVSAQESVGPNGERMLEIYVRDQVRRTISSGAANNEMRTTFGAVPAIRTI